MSSKSSETNTTIDPFTYYGKPNRGQPWILPPASILPPLPKGSFGYGCLLSPNSSLGYPMVSKSVNVTNIASITIDDLCAPGFFCPYFDPTDPLDTLPVVCPATPKCSSDRLGYKLCLPQGRYEPMACPGGFYCPEYNKVLPCPSGNFCPTGSENPRKCPPLSSCPTGSVVATNYSLFIIILILDVLFFATIISRRIFELKRAKQPLTNLLPNFVAKMIEKSRQRKMDKLERNGLTDVELNRKSPDVDSVGATTASVHADSIYQYVPDNNLLVPAFRKGFNGQENLRMDFSFNQLGLKLAGGKTILQGVTGEIRSGRMTCIMGPSGAGKTTFMSVLMGKVKRTGGELRINGVPAEMESFKKIIGYVPQDDVMLRELTVKEIILYSARARLPGSWTSKEIEEHADNVIKVLNLAHVAHSPLGDELTRGVSAGQRKRVNIGMELAAVPLALFLDEPTSGLDATSALDVADVLHSISKLGLTIVSVIHQPRVEIFERFDDVLLIAPGGRTAYLGPVDKAQGYFEALGFYFEPDANRADVLMDILAGRGKSAPGVNTRALSADEIVGRWANGNQKFQTSTELSSDNAAKSRAVVGKEELEASSNSTTTTENNENLVNRINDNGIAAMSHIGQTRGANFITQVINAHNRSLIQQSRFLNSLTLEFAVALLAGGIMGIAAAQESESYHGVLVDPYTPLSASPNEWFLGMYGMLIGIALALASAPAGVKVFGEERAIFFREAAAGHNKLAYYIGKSVSVLYRLCLTTLHFTALYVILAKPPIDVGTQFILLGVSAVVSMLVSRQDAPLVAVIVGLFSGHFCCVGTTYKYSNKNGLIVLFDIGANRWAAEAQFGLWIDYYKGIYDLDLATSHFGYQLDVVTRNLLIMLVIGTGYRVIAFVLMVLLNRDKQR
ncbi:hypothetical protein HDU76_012450 [Blyttiomyces sp. JEL0837]|nr:hypothetical protein HDU76_012450 [Blyttiomyces sp. JEL0837]